MSYYSDKTRKEGNGMGLVGTLLLIAGGCILGAAGRKKERAEIHENIERELGPWHDLKEKNEGLYYKCLRDLEEV